MYVTDIQTEYIIYISIHTVLFILLLKYSRVSFLLYYRGLSPLNCCTDTPTNHNERYGRPK